MRERTSTHAQGTPYSFGDFGSWECNGPYNPSFPLPEFQFKALLCHLSCSFASGRANRIMQDEFCWTCWWWIAPPFHSLTSFSYMVGCCSCGPLFETTGFGAQLPAWNWVMVVWQWLRWCASLPSAIPVSDVDWGNALVWILAGWSFLLPLSDTYTDAVAKLRCLGQGALLFPKTMSKATKFKVYFITWTFTPVIETESSALENWDPHFVICSCCIAS